MEDCKIYDTKISAPLDHPDLLRVTQENLEKTATSHFGELIIIFAQIDLVNMDAHFHLVLPTYQTNGTWKKRFEDFEAVINAES